MQITNKDLFNLKKKTKQKKNKINSGALFTFYLISGWRARGVPKKQNPSAYKKGRGVIGMDSEGIAPRVMAWDIFWNQKEVQVKP